MYVYVYIAIVVLCLALRGVVLCCDDVVTLAVRLGWAVCVRARL